MPYSCPCCRSRKVRKSHRRSLYERILTLFGYDVLRCMDCDIRFRAHVLMPDALPYAKCPRCYRTDLSIWDPKYYRSSFLANLKILLGGNRWRCEACRCNFVSFRPRKEKYRRKARLASSYPTRKETTANSSGEADLSFVR